jgi:predicted nucleic acid-binding protein
MLIYLDICCFNRPFDDQSDLIVRLQTEAKLHVQEMIRLGELELVWSAIMDIENSANPDINRKVAITDWQHLAVVDVSVSEPVEEVAEMLSRIGVKSMDSLHVACAITAHAEFFLTTDKALLRKMATHDSIHVVDPVDFVRGLKGE